MNESVRINDSWAKFILVLPVYIFFATLALFLWAMLGDGEDWQREGK